jgi:SAM-dependent methyltransferase
MVEIAQRRGATLGVEGVEFRVLDAQALDLPDSSVDAVLCRWGLMLMPDPRAALREARRVLRPAGRLAFSVWGPPEQNPWAATVAQALVDAGHMEPPSTGKPGIFALADAERIEALVAESGLSAPTITAVPMQWRFDSFEDYWAFNLDQAGALAMIIERLPGTQRDAVRASVREALGSKAAAGFELDGLCLNVLTRASPA